MAKNPNKGTAPSPEGKTTGGALQNEGTQASHFTLPNGLDVVVIPDHRVPIVTHMVWYRNGSADDPIRTSGIAHFLEHLMFKGTKKHPAGEFSKVVSALGGQENAFTSYDYTAYFQRVPKKSLATMMDFESDRMHNLTLSEDVIIAERDVVMEERRMRTDSTPSAQLSEAISAALFTHHPYGIPVIGWMHEIEGLSRQDALDYYKRFYTPENAILVVAGDVTPAEVKELAIATYGKIPARGSKPVRLRPQEPPSLSSRRLSLADLKVEQPMFSRSYMAPSINTAKGNDAFSLTVLSEVLGSGTTSYFYKKMVLDKKIAVAAGCWYSSDAVDESVFAIYAFPMAGISLEEIEKELDNTLLNAKEEAFDAGALERAKTRLISQTTYARDSQQSMAHMYGRALTLGLSLKDIDEWPQKIEAVTRDDLISVMERFLTVNRSVTGYLLKA